MGFVANIIEDVGDFVGDVFEAVGDVVEDVVDFVGDVIEKVADVVEKVIEDPLPTLLSIAGSFIGIPPYVTSAVIAAARGGDLEDIVLSAGTSYIGGQVGSVLSSTVTSTFVEVGMSETFAEAAGTAISKGLVNGTIAEVKGGDFQDGFSGGFTGSLVSAGVSEVASYVKDDVIQLAQESGLDLTDATTLYNAGTRALSSGITSEITGKGDFATAFTNSAISSGVNYGTKSLNTTIDEQFKNVATEWDKKKEGEPLNLDVTGAGIPNELVSEVQLSDSGVNNTAETVDSNVEAKPAGAEATSDIAVLPPLTEAPKGETVTDFAELVLPPLTKEKVTDFSDLVLPPLTEEKVTDFSDLVERPASDEPVSTDIPANVGDIAASLPIPEAAPKSPLETMAPPVELPAVVPEAPVATDLLTTGLAPETPVGGLNAVAPTTPEEKMASSMGLKPTDITKPLVATAGSLLKQALSQPKKPAPRAPVSRPTGALQLVKSPSKIAPPAKMDVAKLIPIQKAVPIAPPKTLASNAKLTPITNIATLTSLLKRA